MNKASTQMRIWFALFAVIIWLGIYFTGFSVVNWLLYIPAIGLSFAAISGYCPSQITIFKLMGSKE